MTNARAEAPDTIVIDRIRAAAEAGDAAAQLDLANRYYFGDGVARDPNAAYRWMRKAAGAGVAEAQSKVGYFLTLGVGVAADPKGALPWFLKGARGGYAKAAYNLGDAFWKGLHATRSPRRAWFFFSKAVEMGEETGHYGLAALCYKGLGVPRDVGKSLDHLRRAMRGGSTEAIVNMGRLFRVGDAGKEDLAEADARALALHRPGDLASLDVLFHLRRVATPVPPPPPGLDAVIADLDRRQAIGREPEPPTLDDSELAALREKAGEGDAEAGYVLGRVLLRGRNSDTPEALAALLRAAEAGHAAATFQAGTLLFHGFGVPQDVPRALDLLETSGRSGNADAARFLALALDGHVGRMPPEPEKAMEWWNEAARLGDRHACGYVGRILYEEDPAPEGRRRGRELIEFAAERGFPPACGYLGSLRARELEGRDDLVEEHALPLLRLGAVRGDYEAARYLARRLRRLGGRERTQEALYWLREAAHRDAAAARMLGLYYEQDVGGEQGNATAAAWLALAAEESGVDQPDGEAATLLAQRFLDGSDVPRDPLSAIVLAERAARAGYGPGALLLGRIHEDGLGVPRDLNAAVRWYLEGAELGDKLSMYCVALKLFDGLGVEPDAACAVEWLERAARGEDCEGSPLLALMLLRGEGVEPDPARARALFLDAARAEYLPSLFTTLEEESIRFRPAATRPRDLRDRIEDLAADPEALPATAALDAGILIWNGDVGLRVNDALAIDLFRSAARKGSALAAACLSHALHVSGDDEGEMEWLETAARAGHPGAQRHLAYRLVQTGLAVRDDPRVLDLLEGAADQGDVFACVALVKVFEEAGALDDPRRAERVLALRRCAAAGGYAIEERSEA